MQWLSNLMRTITRPVSFVCMCQACTHWLVHAYQYYGISIDNSIDPSRYGNGFCSSSSASNDDYETLLKKLCMPQNAPEWTSEHLK